MKQELGPFLHKHRLAAGYTQMAVAAELGYTTPQFISNWERGVSSPPLNVLAKICEIYGVSEENLFDLVVQSTLVRVEVSMRDEYKRLKKA